MFQDGKDYILVRNGIGWFKAYLHNWPNLKLERCDMDTNYRDTLAEKGHWEEITLPQEIIDQIT